MAQTKTKGAKKSSGGAKRSKGKTATKAKARGTSKARNTSKSNGAGGAKAGREAVKNAGKGVGGMAGKAKVPLLAGGAALVGAAGGAMLSAKGGGRKLMGVPMPQGKRVKIHSKDLRKAAQEVGSFGQQVGELTGELQRIRKGISKA